MGWVYRDEGNKPEHTELCVNSGASRLIHKQKSKVGGGDMSEQEGHVEQALRVAAEYRVPLGAANRGLRGIASRAGVVGGPRGRYHRSRYLRTNISGHVTKEVRKDS
jgi:hypothetical protein